MLPSFVVELEEVDIEDEREERLSVLCEEPEEVGIM
jgi:hypothetical protein